MGTGKIHRDGTGNNDKPTKAGICCYCGKAIRLIPSAEERARKYGESPAFYTALFRSHEECLKREWDRPIHDELIKATLTDKVGALCHEKLPHNSTRRMRRH